MFQPFGNKVEFKDFLDFIFCKITSINLLNANFIICKWISCYYAIIAGYQDYAFKKTA